ncbi:hypothetical protein M9Y10_025806 [Tritrichomonas musculus]|uniref:Uncharacterized protein n=1 Tax=Tritrichomonas musculus TaxID=1915356 RepID=A0ABR2H9Q1_9EUKA
MEHKSQVYLKLEVLGSSGGEYKAKGNNDYIFAGYSGKVKANGGGSGCSSAAGGGSTDISLYEKEGSTEWNHV